MIADRKVSAIRLGRHLKGDMQECSDGLKVKKNPERKRLQEL